MLEIDWSAHQNTWDKSVRGQRLQYFSGSWLVGGPLSDGRERREMVPSAVSGHSQDTTWSPVSGQPRSNCVTTTSSTQHPTTVNSENNMDLQIKENDDKEVGKVNYGTNFNNFIKVRE